MAATDDDDPRYLTRREAELIVANAAIAQADRFAAHQREHEEQRKAIGLALAVAETRQDDHNVAHEQGHHAHEEKHLAEDRAVETALEAVSRERRIHAEAHEREHTSHQREHALNNLAIDKAEAATDKRFESSNAYREQINVLIRTLTSRDSFEGHVKDEDRRLQDVTTAIVELQKYDVRGEGRTRGQGMVVAAIAVSVSIVGGLLGIVIVIANVITAAKP